MNEQRKTAETTGMSHIITTITVLFKKPNILFILGLVGIALVFLSDQLSKNGTVRNENSGEAVVRQEEMEAYAQTLEKRLEALLRCVDGTGEVHVMVTLESSMEYLYAQDETQDTDTQTATDGATQRSENYRSEHVVLDTGEDTPLVETCLEPAIKGVAVVCEGAQDATVQKNITEIVSVVLGVSSNRVCVTKMT